MGHAPTSAALFPPKFETTGIYRFRRGDDSYLLIKTERHFPNDLSCFVAGKYPVPGPLQEG